MFRLLFLLASACSLYEDQAGTYDWSKTNLGKPNDLWLVSRSRSVYISSRGVLSLLKSSGDIEWRRIVHSLDSEVVATASLSEVFTCSSGTLTAWTVDEGQIIWTRPVSPCRQLFLARQGLSDILVVLHSTGIEVLSASDGETIKTIALGEAEAIVSKTADSLVVLDRDFSVWKINLKNWTTEKLEGKYSGKVHCAKADCIAVENNAKAGIYHNGEVRQIDWDHAKISHTLENYFVLTDNSLVEIKDFAPVITKKLPKHTPSQNSAMWVETTSSGFLVHSLESEAVLIQNTKDMPVPLKLWSYSSDKGDILGFLLLEDYRVICFKGPTIRWVREEGLAHVKSLHFAELPSKELHAHNQYFAYVKDHNNWSDVLNNFVLRVQSQINRPQLELDLLEKDAFAFKKLILVSSESGYLMALQSITSQIVWRLKTGSILSLVQINPEELLVVSEDCEKKSILLYVDTTKGRIISSKVLDYQVANVITMGIEEEDISVYLVDNKLTVHPIIQHTHSDLYYYLLNYKENTIEGYRSSNGTTTKIWGMQISKSETITAYNSNKSGKIHQPAIATGTSRLIYKYADENLFAISTSRGQDLQIYVINSISGHIIYKIHQDGVLGAVHMVLHEHKLFTHYWNSRFERFEILSIELFKSNVDDSAKDVLSKYYSGKFSTEYSSLFTPEVTVFTQTYVVPSGVRDMKLTTTLQGITKPALVMILNSNQVYLLDTQLLSPRRRLEDTVEEGIFDDPSLPVYKPSLPWAETNVASYFLQLEGIDRLEIADTWLESTSVVVAFGLDMFVARIMPEKSFDVLGEDFNKGAILLTIVGLVVLNVIVQRWFTIKSAKEKFNT